MLTCLSHPDDRLQPSTYRVDYARHGSAAVMEWVNFVCCMAAYDMARFN